MKYAAAYVRMSDDSQELSPEQQWAQIAARAAQDGYTVLPTGRFEDLGISGWKKKKSRPGFERMMRHVRDGRLRELGIDRLYFWKANRLARRQLIQLETLAALDDAGIEAVSLMEHWPAEHKTRKILQSLTGAFDEAYSDNLSEDVTRGMRSQAAKGFWVYGQVPHGYRGVKSGPDQPPRLEPDPDIWPHLQRLLEMRFGDRDGHRKIAERLTRERIPPPSRADIARRSRPETWRSKHVREILGNLVYTGVIAWHPKDPRTGKRQQDAETGQDVVEILCENAHPALFTREQWEEERRMRAKNFRGGQRRNPIRIGERGLFTPWLRCGHCGATVRIQNGGHPGKMLWYYLCGANLENREACDGFTVRTDLLDPVLQRSIEDAVLTEAGARRLVHATIEKLRATPGGQHAEQRRKLQVADAEVSSKIQRLVALAEATGDVAELGTRLRELKAQRDGIRTDLASIPDPGPLPDPDAVDIEAFRSRILAAWRGKPVLEQRKALQQILDSVVLNADGYAVIRYRWNGADGDIHQLPYGPPNAPTSDRGPAPSSIAGSPASMSGEPSVGRRSQPAGSSVAPSA